jgi:hypothetical protein
VFAYVFHANVDRARAVARARVQYVRYGTTNPQLTHLLIRRGTAMGGISGLVSRARARGIFLRESLSKVAADLDACHFVPLQETSMKYPLGPKADGLGCFHGEQRGTGFQICCYFR